MGSFTLKEMRDEVFEKLGDPNQIETVAFAARIDRALNLAATATADATHCLASSWTTGLVEDQLEYNLANVGGVNEDRAESILYVEGYLDSKWKKIDIIAYNRMNIENKGWRDATSGNPKYCCRHGNALYLNPPSDTAVADPGLRLICFNKAKTMSQDSDTWGVKKEYDEYVMQYATFWLKGDFASCAKMREWLTGFRVKERERAIAQYARSVNAYDNQL